MRLGDFRDRWQAVDRCNRQAGPKDGFSSVPSVPATSPSYPFFRDEISLFELRSRFCRQHPTSQTSEPMHDQPSQANNGNSSSRAFSPVDTGIEDRDLHIEIFAVCDGASEQGGRLSLIGTYDTIGSGSFPFVVPQMTVVLRLRFWPGEARRHNVRLEVTSPDGQRAGSPLEGEMNLHPTDDDLTGAYNIIAHLRDTPIEEPGEHVIDFRLDDQLQGRLPICVRRQAEKVGSDC